MEGNEGGNHTGILKWQCCTWKENKSKLRGNLHSISTSSPLYNIKHKRLKLRLASSEQAIWTGWVPVHFSHTSFIKHNPEVAAELCVCTCMLCANALMTADFCWREQAGEMSLNNRPADIPANTAQSCQGSSLEVSIPHTQPLGMHMERFMDAAHNCVL